MTKPLLKGKSLGEIEPLVVSEIQEVDQDQDAQHQHERQQGHPAHPGMRKLRHVDSNIAASETGPLPRELHAKLRQHRWDREPTAWSQ